VDIRPDLPDLADREDITVLLDDFYRRAFADALLRPVFVDIARMDLSVHIPDITDFWAKVILHEGRYRRNVLTPHRELHERAHLQPRHFERWLALWHATVDDHYSGPHADLAKLQGSRIAFSMCRTVTGEVPQAIGALLEANGTPLGAHRPGAFSERTR